MMPARAPQTARRMSPQESAGVLSSCMRSMLSKNGLVGMMRSTGQKWGNYPPAQPGDNYSGKTSFFSAMSCKQVSNSCLL